MIRTLMLEEPLITDKDALWRDDGGTAFVLASSYMHHAELQIIQDIGERAGRAEQILALSQNLRERQRQNDAVC